MEDFAKGTTKKIEKKQFFQEFFHKTSAQDMRVVLSGPERIWFMIQVHWSMLMEPFI